MFLGELSCLAVYHVIRIYNQRRGTPLDLGNQEFNPLIFLPAALCDMCATSTMYIGLNLTFASSFQMLRGIIYCFCFRYVTLIQHILRITWEFVLPNLILFNLSLTVSNFRINNYPKYGPLSLIQYPKYYNIDPTMVNPPSPHPQI